MASTVFQCSQLRILPAQLRKCSIDFAASSAWGASSTTKFSDVHLCLWKEWWPPVFA